MTRRVAESKAGGPDASYASTADGRIVAWNRAATELLGYDERQAVGARCWELMRGRDIYGEAFCGPGCPVATAAARGECPHRFALNVLRADGRRIGVHVSGMRLPVDGSEDLAVVHVLERCRCEGIAAEIERNGALPSAAGSCRTARDLGWRDRRIVQLLAAGCGTRQIARCLFMRAGIIRERVRTLRCRLGEGPFREAVAAVRGARSR